MTEILHSKILGEGQPLVILHGFLGMSDNWKTLGSQYAENGFQTHLVDQRNHGKSFHSEDFNYDVLAEDVKRYLQFHNLQKVALIGHSMGGKTVMQFACDYPELTEKIVVADISPKYYPPHHQDIITGLRAINFEVVTSRKQAEIELSNHISDFGTRQFLLKNLYWVDKGRLDFRFNLEVLGGKMEEIGENISTTSSYDGPTLFLRGDQSEYVVEADFNEIKRHFPQSHIDVIPNAGHWVHAANPKAFFEKSVLFLNS